MKDTRDLRNPQLLGEDLFWRRSKSKPNKPFHVLADYSNRYSKIPTYPQDESMGVIQAQTYQAELHERAEQGDRYAKSILELGVPGDEPIPN